MLFVVLCLSSLFGSWAPSLFIGCAASAVGLSGSAPLAALPLQSGSAAPLLWLCCLCSRARRLRSSGCAASAVGLSGSVLLQRFDPRAPLRIATWARRLPFRCAAARLLDALLLGLSMRSCSAFRCVAARWCAVQLLGGLPPGCSALWLLKRLTVRRAAVVLSGSSLLVVTGLHASYSLFVLSFPAPDMHCLPSSFFFFYVAL